MRYGDRGQRVRQLQRALILAGWSLARYGPDGIFGGETHQAATEWASVHAHPAPAPRELEPSIVDAIIGHLAIEGCDVAGYQKRDRCDWAAAFESGCRFVVVKLSEGMRPTDSGVEHIERIREQAPEMLIGGYHYGRMAQDPVEQAELASNLAAGLGVRLALDLEDWASDHWVALMMPRWVKRGGDPENIKGIKRWGASWMIEQTRAWTSDFVGACDLPPILYVQPSFWEYRLGKSASFTDCPLWHAGGWDGEGLPAAADAPDDMTPPWPRVSMWQTHGNSGRRPWYRDGKGAIDRDVFIGSEAELAALFDVGE